MNIFTLALILQGLQAMLPSEAFTSPCSSLTHHHTSPRATTVLRAEEGSKERKPWDVLRFVSQSSKFVTPPPIPFIGGPRNGGTRKIGPGETLWSSSSSNSNFFNFGPLDDVVMGGASSSNIDNNTGMWKGTVTDANNGGFVGIRSTPFKNGLALDLSDCNGVELRLRLGGGKRFKFVVRDSTEFNGICWTTAFDAGGGNGAGGGLANVVNLFNSPKNNDGTRNGVDGNFMGAVIRVPFAKQIPTIFAKTVSGKTFDVKNVVGFQLAYSKFDFDGKLNNNFELGDFSLQILELRTY